MTFNLFLKLLDLNLEWCFANKYYVHCFRKLEDGDIVNVDVTVYYRGVHGEKYISLEP